MLPLIVICFVAAAFTAIVVISYILSTYNKLVSARQRLLSAWAQIDVHLKQRWDLVPNLVAVVQGNAAHERETLERVVCARSSCVQANDAQRQTSERELGDSLRSLVAIAESYPQLKANQSFVELSKQLQSLEEGIAYARHFYNDVVSAFNILTQSFPTVVVAQALRIRPADFFSLSEAIEATVPSVRVLGESGQC